MQDFRPRILDFQEGTASSSSESLVAEKMRGGGPGKWINGSGVVNPPPEK